MPDDKNATDGYPTRPGAISYAVV